MEILNIAGKWKGKIWFGNEYPENIRASILHFEVEIAQDGEAITATAMDIEGLFINPDPATIKGCLKNNEVIFVKKYSSFHFLDDGKQAVDKCREGPPIYYKGEYDIVSETFHGTWDFEKNKSYWSILNPFRRRGRGTWEMER